MSAAPRMPHSDPITREHCTPAMILDAWHRTSARFQESRRRGLICHNLRHNIDQTNVPETWQTKEDQEQVATLLPERQLLEQGIVNSLSEYWPVYRRQPINGATPTQIRQAGELERWLSGCDEEQMDRESIWLKSAEDGEFAYILMPDLADYHRAPSYSDVITDAEYRALADDERRDWRADGDAREYRRPKRSYWRDERGKPTGDTARRSERHTREAYEQDIATLTKRLPWVERIVSMYDCAPILTRGRGRTRYECAGLIVRTLYDIEQLMTDGWRWIDMDNAGLIPRGFARNQASRGAGGSLYLYEYYGYDTETDDDSRECRVPFAAYCVAGVGTTRQADGATPARDECDVIDLRATFGLDELPIGYFWAMRTAADDPDYIGRPLMWPLVATITNLEKIVTAKNAFDWDAGFSGHVMPINPALPEAMQLALVENGEFKPFMRPEPGEVVVTGGSVQPFTTAQASPGIGENIGFHADRLQRNRPQDTPGQRASGASGHSLLVADDLDQQAHRQIRECVRQVCQFAARMRIKFGCAFERRFGVRIPVAANLPRSAESGVEMRGLIEFDERWIGDVYHVSAEFPRVGNLAEAQQYADFKERGLVLWEEFREKLGDEDPANTKVLRDVEAYYDSPTAMLRLDAAVAEQLNDRDEKARLEAELQGLLTPDGVPPSALAGAPVPGVGVPDMAASALGGMVAGAIGQAAVASDATALAGVPGGA